MDEVLTPLQTVTANWGTVGATPNVSEINLPMKTTIRDILIQLSGAWDQSVGAEVQATEGNTVLIDEIRLVLDGQTRRTWKGPVLYEYSRILAGGALSQVDPAVGVATGKAFSSTFNYDMGFFDLQSEPNPNTGRLESVISRTFIDLLNYTTATLQIVWQPFNRYVSGNTQANMTATIRATVTELPGLRRPRKQHFESVLVNTIDLTATGADRTVDLLRDLTLTRGIIIRVGTINATPALTAITALTQVGVKASIRGGMAVEIKKKAPVSTYQLQVGKGQGRSGIALRAGYLYLDFASDRRLGGCQNGNLLSTFQLIYDNTGTANTFAQVFQLCARK